MSTLVTAPLSPTIRTRLEQAIESLIALLDTMEPDPDLERMLGWPQQGLEALEPGFAAGDPEEENEHGGDVEDEPQFDATESAEDIGSIHGGHGS